VRKDYTKPESLLWQLFLLASIPMVFLLTFMGVLEGYLWISGKSMPPGSPAIPYHMEIISGIILPVLWFLGIKQFNRPEKSARERLLLVLLLFTYGIQLLVSLQGPAEDNGLLVMVFFLWDFLVWAPVPFLAGLCAIRIFTFHGR
jgi:hypothetical protein